MIHKNLIDIAVKIPTAVIDSFMSWYKRKRHWTAKEVCEFMKTAREQGIQDLQISDIKCKLFPPKEFAEKTDLKNVK